jgi:hypothetical protein
MDMVQELECEKKLNMQMVDVLENKISELLADNALLKQSNIQIQKDYAKTTMEIANLKE